MMMAELRLFDTYTFGQKYLPKTNYSIIHRFILPFFLSFFFLFLSVSISCLCVCSCWSDDHDNAVVVVGSSSSSSIS